MLETNLDLSEASSTWREKTNTVEDQTNEERESARI